MPTCRLCGRSDPRSMIGLTTPFFGAFVGLPPESGYFYLCPSCFAEGVEPHLDALREKLAHLHPSPGHPSEDPEHRPEVPEPPEDPEDRPEESGRRPEDPGHLGDGPVQPPGDPAEP